VQEKQNEPPKFINLLMLFNSYSFFFIFLPSALTIYFILNKLPVVEAGKIWLVFISFIFYAYCDTNYLVLLPLSIIINYFCSRYLSIDDSDTHDKFLYFKKKVLLLGIIFNLCLLGYFKYANFFISETNNLFHTNISLQNIVIPLAISFFTFNQIACLVDSYKKNIKGFDFVDYCLFVSYFPYLISGPLVRYTEIMPQFNDLDNRYFNYQNISEGLFLLSIGLFKKVIIADNIAVWAINGFDKAATLTFLEAWTSSFCYTLQLYFDFSGYIDMALGIALMFNIKLPINFNSPYKALNIRDFWLRWHMTLSRWLRDYLYIPLGGNRNGRARTSLNLFLTFLLCGLWHGAGSTFLVWGILHGCGVIIHSFWRRLGVTMPNLIAWLITIMFVNFAWVFFRAKEFKDAYKVIGGMTGFSGIVFPGSLAYFLNFLSPYGVTFGNAFIHIEGDLSMILMLLISIGIVLYAPNSMELKNRFNPSLKWAICTIILMVSGLLCLTKITDFQYVNF